MLVGTIPKWSKQTEKEKLETLTHLHLEAKGLGVIENLHHVKNLKHLYLQDNYISEISNSLAGLRNLT